MATPDRFVPLSEDGGERTVRSQTVQTILCAHPHLLPATSDLTRAKVVPVKTGELEDAANTGKWR